MKKGEQRSGLLDDGFRNLVYQKTESTGCVFVQLDRHHVLLHRGRKSLPTGNADKPAPITARVARLFQRRVIRKARNRFPRLDRIVV